MLRYMAKYGSSISNRGCAFGNQARSRLLSTSAWTASIAGGASVHAPRSRTASAASSVKPPSKTEHCASAACSQGVNRSQDQSIAARKVACLAATPLAPASSTKRFCRRSHDLRRREHPHPRCRQFDGQRQAVQQLDHLRHRRAVVRRRARIGGAALWPGRRTARSPRCPGPAARWPMPLLPEDADARGWSPRTSPRRPDPASARVWRLRVAAPARSCRGSRGSARARRWHGPVAPRDRPCPAARPSATATAK